jgi:hypothetical protein
MGGKLDQTAVDRFFIQLGRLDETQLMLLPAMARSVDRAEHDAALREVRRVAAANGLLDEIQAIRDEATHWATRGTNIPPLQPIPMDFELNVTMRMQAAGPIADAAVAFALGRLLDAGSSEILLGPWLAATGPTTPTA